MTMLTENERDGSRSPVPSGGLDHAAPMPASRRTRRVLGVLAVGLVLGAALFVVGALGSVSRDAPAATVAAPAPGALSAAVTGRASGVSIEELIAELQARLQTTPTDPVSWATLGLAYVQQARIAVDPTFYPLAEGALERSLEINGVDNFLAYAGLSALASARHDFASAKTNAERGLAINPYSSILYGALSDAEIQLGHYDAAFDAVQRMVDLSPDTASLTRASYTWELRGDLARAEQLMQRALDDAPTAADRAFTSFQLGELALNAGDANTALERFLAALTASPQDPAALGGKARAEAALGQIQTALDDYATLVGRVPDPAYLLEYAELLESVGRNADAQEQFRIFTVTQGLFAANGVQPDAVLALYLADHGDPRAALAAAQTGLASNPFLTMYDAYAWALHRNGRDEEALVAIDEALSLGYRSARFHFHAGMISAALGDRARATRELETALAINPNFNPLEAVVARSTLAALDDG